MREKRGKRGTSATYFYEPTYTHIHTHIQTQIHMYVELLLLLASS